MARELIRAGLITLTLCAGSAMAGEVSSRTQLDALLGDKLILEEFEGLSVHGGTGADVPNPLDTDTTPASWGFQTGVTYASPGSTLRLYGSFVNGQDSVILEAFDGMTIDYHQRQAAIGWLMVNPTGNVTRTYTAHFMRSGVELGQVERVVGPASSAFVGWFDPLGIDRVEITALAGFPGSDGFLAIDDMGFGWEVSHCPADLSGSSDPRSPDYGVPDGIVDASDFFYFLERFADGDQDVADLTGSSDPNSPAYGVADGSIDASDFFFYLMLFEAGCV